jgi:hypothetical protein
LVSYQGKVIQVQENWREDSYTLRVDVTQSEYGYWSDTVWLDYQGKRLLEDDIISIVARVEGLKTYSSIFGQSITIPHLKAVAVELDPLPKTAEDLTPTITPVPASTSQPEHVLSEPKGTADAHIPESAPLEVTPTSTPDIPATITALIQPTLNPQATPMPSPTPAPIVLSGRMGQVTTPFI